jgi:hypothetical protein
MPEYHIRQQLKDTPQNIFSKVGFSGDHSRTIALGTVRRLPSWRGQLQSMGQGAGSGKN